MTNTLFLTARYRCVMDATGAWFVEDAATGSTVGGPYWFRADAIEAANRLALRR